MFLVWLSKNRLLKGMFAKGGQNWGVFYGEVKERYDEIHPLDTMVNTV